MSVPANPTFSIFNYQAPTTFTATGNTTAALLGDEVDLRCYTGPTVSTLLRANLGLGPGGSFVASGLSTEGLPTCRLRAVPAGTEPTETAPFGGPVLANGESRLYRNEGTVNAGIPEAFYINGQQLEAADDYGSIGECGLADAYLRVNEFEQHSTFFCNDFHSVQGRGGQPESSEFRVDGENAYFTQGVASINQEAEGFPPLDYSYAQNPVNGNLTIHDGESPVICGEATFPPNGGSCAEVIPSGVRDERTIEQVHDGQIVLITDNLVSTDGKSHQVEAFPENEQDFNRHGEQLEYKFPGESGYVPRVKGETVAIPSLSPAAIYMRVTGSADGDKETGRGAIVFFQPSSPAYFNEFAERRNGFYFANQATVPAGGSATIKYAYVSAFGQAEVEALVQEAVTPPEGPAPPIVPGSVAKPPATPGSPSTTFRIRAVQHIRTNGTAKLKIDATGPGRLQLSGRRVKSVGTRVTQAGTTYLKVTPDRSLKKLVAARGVVETATRIKFTPDSGSAGAKAKKIHLVLSR